MTERIAPDVLADLCEPQDLSISPDGKRVLYMACPVLIRKSENVQSSLWIAEVGKEHSARQIVSDDYNNFAPKFCPNGKYISFLSDRARPGKGAILYLLPLDGGEAFPLTSKDNEMGIGAYKWRPDGKAIAFISADEKSEERKQKDKDKDDAKVYEEDVHNGRLRIIDLESKEVQSLRSVEGNGLYVAWNAEGTKIAYAVSRSPLIDDVLIGEDIHIVDVKEDSAEKLCRFPTWIRDVSWHKDRILWTGQHVPDNITSGRSVFALSIKDVSSGPKAVANGIEDCAQSIKICGDEIIVHVQQGLAEKLQVLDGEELYKEKRMLSNWSTRVSNGQRVLAICQGSTGKPVEVFSIVNRQKVQLSQLGKHVADKEVGAAHLCEYTHEDGTPIDGFYAVPTALKSAFEARKPQPTVLVLRGGPYGRVTDCFDVIWHETTFFMSLGYLVLCPNYRGGASHGHDYANAVHHNAAASYQDVIWLVKKGIEEGRIDSDRVAITGWSQGGYLSYLSVTRDDVFHFRAAVPGAGVTDWTTMTLTSDLPHVESAISGPSPWEVKDIHDVQARKSSPIYFMQNIKTPCLLVHGEADERVPVEQAIGFYRGMKARNQDVTLITYPRESHCQPMPWEKKHYIHMLERVEKFLGKHMP